MKILTIMPGGGKGVRGEQLARPFVPIAGRVGGGDNYWEYLQVSN